MAGSRSGSPGLPVLVYIHSGGFVRADQAQRANTRTWRDSIATYHPWHEDHQVQH